MPKMIANATAPAAAAGANSHVGAGGALAMASIRLCASSSESRPASMSATACIVETTRSISTPTGSAGGVGDRRCPVYFLAQLHFAPARQQLGMDTKLRAEPADCCDDAGIARPFLAQCQWGRVLHMRATDLDDVVPFL